MSRLSLERLQSRAAEIIRSLPSGDSSALRSLDLATDLLKQARPCDFCAQMFVPKRTPLARFCSSLCSMQWLKERPDYKALTFTPEHARKSGEGRKRWLTSGHQDALEEINRLRNLRPSTREDVQEKISAALRAIKHRPLLHGGNGRGPTKPQLLLHLTLGPDWIMEFIVPTKIRLPKWPAAYKIDLAHPGLKIAIEVDGPSHHAKRTQESDRRKEEFLRSDGWTVLRFWNQQILDWITSGMPTESSISTTFKQHGILPSALTAS